MMIDEEKVNEFLDSEPPVGTLMGFESYRHWLADLLITLQREGESFSGKRPNCDSGWDYDLAIGLAVIEPKIAIGYDDDGYADINWALCNDTFRNVINTVFGLSDDD